MVNDIEVVSAFDFAGRPEESFGSPRETPWRGDIPYSNYLRTAVEHLQEMDANVPQSDWRYGVYRFQIDLIQRGYLQSFHLETGRPIRSRLSFPVGGDQVLNPVFYRFDEPEEHYFIIGFHPPRLVGVFFPERRLMVTLMNHDHPVLTEGWEPARMAMSCVMLEELMRVNPDSVDRYRAAEETHRLTLTQAFHPNAGHQLREEFPMLWKLYTQTDSDAALLTGQHDVLGLADRLPTRIERESVHFNDPEVPWEVNYFQAAMERGLLVGRIGCSSHMPQNMQLALQDSFFAQHPEYHAQIAGQLAGHWPVIWLTLRTHNRRWVGEGEHLKKLTESVLDRYPKAAFMLDGLPDCRPTADQINSGLAPVADMVGCSFTEAQACFSLCDAYVMPYSNSCAMHMVDPRPGVVHGLKGWIPDEPFEPARTENPILAHVVHGTKHLTGNDTYDAWVTTCDYDLSPEPVIESLLEVLSGLPERVSTT